MVASNLIDGIIGMGKSKRLSSNSSHDDETAVNFHLLASIFQAKDEGVAIFGPDLNLKYVTPNIHDLSDRPASILTIGTPYKAWVKNSLDTGRLQIVLPGVSLESYMEEHHSMLNSRQFLKIEFQYTRHDSRVIKCYKIITAEQYTIFHMTDVTAEVERDTVFEVAVSTEATGYATHNLSTGQNFVSETILDLFDDAQKENIKQEGLLAATSPKARENIIQLWKHAFQTGEDVRAKLQLELKNKEIGWFRIVGRPTLSLDGTPIGMVTFITDITDENKSRNALEESKQTAELSLRSNVDFLARIGHEIRTPMNGIIGMSSAMIQNNQDEVLINQLSVINRSADSLLKVLDQTLEHARISTTDVAINTEDCSPREFLSDLHQLWTDRASQNGTSIQLRIDRSLPETLNMDPFRYKQCLNNLISNAVKFTAGGTVTITSAVVERNGVPTLITAVKDSGIGMTETQMSRIFIPYAQADDNISRQFGGTGLGMTITKTLIERMGGTIRVKSKLGEGTTFVLSTPVATAARQSFEAPEPTLGSIYRPATARPQLGSLLPEISSQPMRMSSLSDIPQSPAPTPTRAASIPVPSPTQAKIETATQLMPTPEVSISTRKAQMEPISASLPITAATATRRSTREAIQSQRLQRLSTLKILVAEDNETNQIVINASLKKLVGDIVFANHGQEAIDQLEAQKFDIILMDIHMPVMDGIEATLSIRSSDKPYANTPIIALTADPEYQQKRICMNIGMNDALSKPFNRNDIIVSFSEVLESIDAKQGQISESDLKAG